jgi:hypothetical protein
VWVNREASRLRCQQKNNRIMVIGASCHHGSLALFCCQNETDLVLLIPLPYALKNHALKKTESK